MAGISAGIEVKPPGTRQDYTGPLGDLGWGLAWVDYAVYSVERLIVVLAMVVMSLIEAVYILYENVNSQRLALRNWSEGQEGASFPIGLLVLIAFIGALIWAAVSNTWVGRNPDGVSRPMPTRLLAFGLAMAGSGILAVLTVWLGLERSWVFYMIITALIGTGSVVWFWSQCQRREMIFTAVATGVMILVASKTPSGYSWADDYALFLLMWTGFLGASMATREAMHIRMDVMRKFCPPHLLPYFNAASYGTAAAFTGVLCFLGYRYIFAPETGRFYAITSPGEIPDWLLIAAIPVALLLIAARFLGRAVLAIISPPPPEEAPKPDAEQAAEGQEVTA